jgi:hypothetical protein
MTARRSTFVLGLTLFLLHSLSAVADEASAAREHYEMAQRLYGEGRYEDAIAEFQSAYRLKPHPNVLYSIAQAYERLLEYDKSLSFFDLYLAEAPADAEFRTIVENRVRVLRGLPARISITSIPEHVQAFIVGQGVQLHSETPALFRVPAGSYEIKLERDGWDTETHTLRAEIGQPYFYQYRLERSTSEVVLTSRPAGARVFVDDRLVGETPFRARLEVGHHRLLLEHRDYPWHREEFDVPAGRAYAKEIRLERPGRSGRAELVLASMIYGGVAGPLLVAAISNDTHFSRSVQGFGTLLLASAAGIGAGFLGSFLPTKAGIPAGQSSLLIGGGAYGTGLGASLALGLGSEDRWVFGASLIGGAVGITATALIGHHRKISEGDAAMVNSGALWGTAAGALLAQAISRSPSRSELGWSLLGGTSLGLLGGSIAALVAERSRGQVALVDVGGLTGIGLGFALGFAVGTNDRANNGVQMGARFAVGGLGVGLLTATLLLPRTRIHVPTVGGVAVRDHGHWRLGIPEVRIEQTRLPEGIAGRFTLDILKGQF